MKRECQSWTRALAVLATAVFLAGPMPRGWTREPDHLSTLPLSSWSPNQQWLAFNWPYQDDLFVISLATGRSCLLKPLGDLELETTWVVSPSETPRADWRSHSRLVPTPGTGPLAVIEWSPDSLRFAYRMDRDTRGIFSVGEERVVGRLAAGDRLPWARGDDLQVATELGATDRGSRYWIRVQQADGTIRKQVEFDDPREIRCMCLAAYRHSSLSSPDLSWLLYPRVSDDGWRLMREPTRGDGPARAVTAPSAQPPRVWALAGAGRDLAVAEKGKLIVGSVEDWAKARTVPLESEAVELSWSPDGRYLAYLQGTSLNLLGRDDPQPVRLTDSCAPRFWGWRGPLLYFGNERTGSADLYRVKPPERLEPVQVAKQGPWQYPSRKISVAPDGAKMVCIVSDIDGSGRGWWQLWQMALPTNEPLQVSTNILLEGLIIESKPVEVPRVAPAWQLLHSVPLTP